MKRVAILQSNYIPWKGYFDMIASVDVFILYDEMQYTRRDWRNRNQIKTPNGVQWLTVPVNAKGKYNQKIVNTEIMGADWAVVHWKSLTANYGRAPHFDEVADWLKPLYMDKTYTHISQLNRQLIESVCSYLSIETTIRNSGDFNLTEGKTERLADLCKQVDGTEYISGPAAKDYIEEAVFCKQRIKLTWFDYSGYHEYPQLWGDFVHGVTILDLLFNCGKDARLYMKFT